MPRSKKNIQPGRPVSLSSLAKYFQSEDNVHCIDKIGYIDKKTDYGS